MRQFGLIGYPLSHSFSPAYFKAKFEREHITDAVYSLYELKSVTDFPEWLKAHPSLLGINVTIPYKSSIIPFLNNLDETATKAGAVNTITLKNGKLIGYNTDVYGFKTSLLRFIGTAQPAALVLGTGGSSKAVTMVLKELRILYLQVSRTQQNNCILYEELSDELLKKHPLLINCTPLGKYPDVESKPTLPYSALTAKHFLFDLNYNPEQTAFLEAGKQKGAAVKNGFEMLTLQADAAWEIWNTKV